MSCGSKYYFPQLDSIRGLSVLAVFFFHAIHPDPGTEFFSKMIYYFHANLFLGLDVFFILSSFLLTWLGINEYKTRGDFSFVNYFIRRALRIWPLYILLMIFSFVIVPYASAYFHVPVTLPPAYYYLFFVSNFYLEGHVYFLRFLWTLSVEEQFYLLWGLCLLLLQKRIVACAIVLAVTSITYSVYAVMYDADSYFNTLIYLFDFAIGILAAVLLHSDKYIITFFKKMFSRIDFIFLLLLPVLFFIAFCITYFAPHFFSTWLNLVVRYLFVTYVGLFIIEQMVNEKTVLKLKTQRFLVYTGKISYGFYCFHGIVLTFGLIVLQKTGIDLPEIVKLLLFLLVNYIISIISYKYVERPFLLLKNKWKRP